MFAASLWLLTVVSKNINDICRPSPKRLSKNEWYLPQFQPIRCFIPKEKKTQNKRSWTDFSFIFISRWWANFEFPSSGSISSAIRCGTQVIGWTKPWRSTTSTIYKKKNYWFLLWNSSKICAKKYNVCLIHLKGTLANLVICIQAPFKNRIPIQLDNTTTYVGVSSTSSNRNFTSTTYCWLYRRLRSTFSSKLAFSISEILIKVLKSLNLAQQINLPIWIKKCYPEKSRCKHKKT